MKPSSVYTCKKWFTVLGSFLIVFPIGVPWYWGNVSVYATSYILKTFPSTSHVESPWVMTLVVIGYLTGLFSAIVLPRFISKRLTVFFGIVVFNAGWLGGYFAIQKSLLAMNLILGLVTSHGTYIIHGTIVSIVLGWCEDDVGKVSSIAQSGFTAGAVVYNQMVTLYVNPHNLSPDKHVGPSKFFSQDEVVDNVTTIYLIIAVVSFTVSVIGLLLIREAENNNHILSETVYGSNQQASCSGDIESIAISELPRAESNLSKPPVTSQSRDLSPKQVLRSYTLYIYWAIFVMAEIPYIVLTNYYKAYGQLYVEDDHFLTNLSTVLLVFITLSRTFWGFMLDKFGEKIVFIFFYSACAICSLCFYFSPLLNKWCYAFMTVTFGCAIGSFFLLFCFLIVESFGKKYFIFNFGIAMFPALFTNLALPTILESLLIHLGWFYVFAFCSCCNLIGLIVAVIFLQPKGR